jgi:hypothetical protein
MKTIIENLQALVDSVEFAETEYKANYVITTQDKKLLTEALNQALHLHSVMQGLPSRNLLDECWRSAFTAFIDCCKTKTEFNSETEFNKYYTELSTKLQ